MATKKWVLITLFAAGTAIFGMAAVKNSTCCNSQNATTSVDGKSSTECCGLPIDCCK